MKNTKIKVEIEFEFEHDDSWLTENLTDLSSDMCNNIREIPRHWTVEGIDNWYITNIHANIIEN
ncbi:hypothetical protein CMI47_13135 [Candidatus Pacearchaeota archaeon]|nr:hypothetical protein [Candidatus Pacearchaeota archaeon]|tara:strand:- start:1179 stop:1370 length:192 start_codon:yes stop_codon:yes gene_type:complete